MTAAEILIAIATGLVAGAYAGLLGVGGGIVMVPAMVVLLDQPQHVAAGTSLLVIVPTAIAGTRANVRRGLLDRAAALWLGAGGIAGAAAGALVSLRVLDDRTLRRTFGVFLIAIAIRLLVRRGGAQPAEP